MIKVSDLYKSEYYVYEHMIDNSVFYVGKGKGVRAVNFYDRSSRWTLLTDGRLDQIQVRIIRHFDDVEEALKHEMKHIKKLYHEGVKLVNRAHNNNRVAALYGENYLTSYNNKLFPNAEEKRIIDKYVNVSLTIENKNELCETLNIPCKGNRSRSWRTIKGILQKSGYVVRDSKKTINGKRVNISTISIEKGIYGTYD